MTNEEKQLLFKDLCARLPYEVKINIRNDYTLTMEDIELNPYHLTTASYDIEYRGLRPYLRLMSSMTEEEENELVKAAVVGGYNDDSVLNSYIITDWLNAHHFNYRLPPHLFIEAPADMYKTE